MSNERKYKCPYCEERKTKVDLVHHIDRKHEEIIPENYTASRVVFNMINKKECGHCVNCGKETKWNENTWKYNRYCSEKCLQDYSKMMKQRMKKVYGKEHLLNDPNVQEKMLKNRSISGTYKFKDGGKRDYCGSYEKKLLEFFDNVLHVESYEIETPGPVIPYEYNGKQLFWITDLYYSPANLVFDVKDGGDNPNKREMKDYREKQIAKENAIRKLNKYNYIRLTNNNFEQLLLILAEIKQSMLSYDNPENIIRINEFVPGTGSSNGFIINRVVDNVFVNSYFAQDELDDYYFYINGDKIEKVKRKDIPMGEYHIFKFKNNCSYFNKYLESNIGNKVDFDKDFFYESLTGKNMLTPDQIIYDENFEEIESSYRDIKLELINASMNYINNNDMGIPILEFDVQKDIQNKYENLEVMQNWNGYYVRNINNNFVSEYVESLNELESEVLSELNKF